MLRILLYAYATGVRSSRKIAASLVTDVAFRVLAGELFPDFRTISNFRKRHQEEFAAVFAQVVQIAQEAGLVKLGTVAIDGSKVRANASRHRAMSYDRMQQEEKRLQQQIRRLEVELLHGVHEEPREVIFGEPVARRRRQQERLRRVRVA